MNVDSFRLRFLMEQLRQRSDDQTVQDVLKVIGIRNPENPIEAVDEAQFIRVACDVLKDPLFGIKAGLNFRHSTTLVGYVAKYSRSLEMAIRNARRINGAVFPAYDYLLTVSGNAASFELFAVDAQLSKFHRHREMLMFGALSYLRELTQTGFYPLEMRFDHLVGGREADIRKMAGCPVMFGAEKLEMILPLSALDIPVPTYEPALRDHLIAYGERLVADQPNQNPSLRARVEGILVSGLPDRLVPAEEVASDIGMSPRTMARRLKDEGLTFRSIVDDLRLDLGKTYLKSGISVTEVAFLLDYADTAGFSTAFKRWTGVSPRQFAHATE